MQDDSGRILFPAILGVFLFGMMALWYPCVYMNALTPTVRMNPEPSQTLKWKEGTVGSYDYCPIPGAYDYAVEWRAESGERIVLAEPGDSIPEVTVDHDCLHVKWLSRKHDRYHHVVYRSPTQKVGQKDD